MKSFSGSCETDAYVFLISLFRSWTSMSTSLAIQRPSPAPARLDFFNDLVHPVRARGFDVWGHPLEAGTLLLLQPRLLPRLRQVEVVEAKRNDLVGIVDVAQDVRAVGALRPLLGLPGFAPLVVAARLESADCEKRVHG